MTCLSLYSSGNRQLALLGQDDWISEGFVGDGERRKAGLGNALFDVFRACHPILGNHVFPCFSVACALFVQYKLNSMNVSSPEIERLSELEREMIELFVRMADMLNLPRSVGEIYGLLFSSAQPLCLDDCRRRLEISKGSTSQGLRILKSFGAIRTVYVPGDRKDYFVAETSLRKIAAGFANEQIRPHVDGGRERLERLRGMLADYDGDRREGLEARIEILENWQRRAGTTLPIVLRLIGGQGA